MFLGISCGRIGYRSIHKFTKANEAYFTDIFSLKHGVPSHVTLRQLLLALDKDTLSNNVLMNGVLIKIYHL
ncbi:transposase family protein [Arcicella sp. BE51]|uniref:transposase family protein n=1 Tax=Arcicella sp. BE51 TaxID=2817774 RepID=UPI0038D3C796